MALPVHAERRTGVGLDPDSDPDRGRNQREKPKVICWANRNGFYYLLDRITGKFLVGTPFVEQNWTKGLDSAGRPIPLEEARVSPAGRLTRPGVLGGTNWQNAAFDHEKGLVFVHATEGASVFTKSPEVRRGDGGVYLASAGSVVRPVVTVVRALDAATGTRRWERIAPPSNDVFLAYSGLLATDGDLVFGASGTRVCSRLEDRSRVVARVP